MLRRQIFFIAILAAIIAIGVFIWQDSQKLPPNSIKIDGQIFSVRLAETPQQQIDGLAGVAKLDQNHGMLFMLNGRPASFWMKGMIMDIDIIWIKDNKVVGIDHNAVAPDKNTPDSQLTSYTSPIQYPDAVLEIAAGQAKAHNLTIGDAVEINL